MKESKKILIKDVTRKINKLPEDDKQFILGVMQGIMISSGSEKREENKKEQENK